MKSISPKLLAALSAAVLFVDASSSSIHKGHQFSAITRRRIYSSQHYRHDIHQLLQNNEIIELLSNDNDGISNIQSDYNNMWSLRGGAAAAAAVIDPATKITFDETIEKSKQLTLLGVGVRKRGPIKVYSVGVYATPDLKSKLLSTTSQTKETALSTLVDSLSSSKSNNNVNPVVTFVLKMNFKVSADKIASAIVDSVIPRAPSDDDAQEHVEQLQKVIIEGVVATGKGAATPGTELEFDCLGNGSVRVTVDGAVVGSASGLASAFANVFLDKEGVSPALRENIVENCCTVATAKGAEQEEEEDGSIEITMSQTPEGKSNVKTKFQLPKAVKDVASSSSTTSEETSAASSTPLGLKKDQHISASIPITPAEMPHFASMSIMMFLFIYVFTTVRDTKDTLVVSNCGAEAIPFLKLYGVMPCATAFIVLYSKMSNVLGKQTLFYATLLPFFVFYGVFAFILFPNRDLIHFPLVEGAAAGGGVLTAATNLMRYWSFSLFFIVSELWASAGVPLLFWQVSVLDMYVSFHIPAFPNISHEALLAYSAPMMLRQWNKRNDSTLSSQSLVTSLQLYRVKSCRQ